MTILTRPGIALLCVSVVVAVVIVELTRRRRLRESYAMLWLGVSLVLLLFALFPLLLVWASHLVGMDYQSLALLTCFLFLTAICLQYAVALSRRADENRRIVQRLAIMQEKLERLETRLGLEGDRSGEPPAGKKDS